MSAQVMALYGALVLVILALVLGLASLFDALAKRYRRRP